MLMESSTFVWIEPDNSSIEAELFPSLPPFPPIALHRDVSWVFCLDPRPAPPGPIFTINPLRNNSFGAKPADVFEDGRTILGDVVVEQDPGIGAAQQLGESGFAL